MPPPDQSRVTGSMAGAAQRLASAAHALAAVGAVADDVFSGHLAEVPAELAAALAPVLAPPERAAGLRVVRGLLDGYADPGPTPPNWRQAPSARTAALDIAVVLAAATLGRVFGWAGQQDGRLVHNIVPSRGAERLQVGASSAAELVWHTEDAFHPRRAGLLLLACVRNDDGVGSGVASVRRATLTGRQVEVLGRRRVAIVPDDSYPGCYPGSYHGSYPGAWSGSERRRNAIATVWRADDGLCLRYDPSYTRFLDPDPEFADAYAALGRSLGQCGEQVLIGPGDVLLIDNDVAVHGRLPFAARYDGTDRWLKRVQVRLPRRRPPGEDREDGYGQVPIEPAAASSRS